MRDEIYKKENPIDTKDFTFEKAVEGCCVATTQFWELDKNFLSIYKLIKEKNVPARLKSGDFDTNPHYPESEKEERYRVYNKRLMIFSAFIFSPLVFLIFPLILYYVFVVRPFKAIRKEAKMYPWHFNNFPVGSVLYLLTQDCNDILEKKHCLYYDLYLPCKNKASELIGNRQNREGEYYEAYLEVLKYESDLYPRTPMQFIKKERTNANLREWKIAAAVVGIGTVAVTAGFAGMLNNAGKDIGKR